MEIETYFKLKPLNKLKISNGAIVNLIKWIGHVNINASLTCEWVSGTPSCLCVSTILHPLAWVYMCLCACTRNPDKARCWVHAPSRPACTSVFTRPWRLQTDGWLASLRWTIPPPPHLKIVTIFRWCILVFICNHEMAKADYRQSFLHNWPSVSGWQTSAAVMTVPGRWQHRQKTLTCHQKTED